MTRVKICGIRTLEDAQVAAEAGADFIGLVFVPGRRRRLEIDAAREIVAGFKGSLETAPKVVGLFADQPLEEVNQTIDACNLDLAQLCGAESLDYCRNTNAQVVKVLHIPRGQPSPASTQELSDRILAHAEAGHLVTLDRLVEGLQGGTGESFDWSIAANLSRQGHNFLMAGGAVARQRNRSCVDGASLGSGRLQRCRDRRGKRPPENPRFHPKRPVSGYMLTFARNSHPLPVILVFFLSFPRRRESRHFLRENAVA